MSKIKLSTLNLKMPSTGKVVPVQVLKPTFRRWKGHPNPKIMNNKNAIELNGAPSVGELGWVSKLPPKWAGAWVYKPTWTEKRDQHVLACSDISGGTWEHKPKHSGCTELVRPTYVRRDLPDHVIQLIGQIYKNGKLPSGCWDVVAWNGNQVRFYECKQVGKDRLQESQIAFLESALQIGIKLEDFFVVEWVFED